MQQNYSLLQHNTFGMNVRADYFVEYDSVEKLTEFLQTDLAKTEQLLPIGEGSNLLFVGDFRGVILHSKIRFTEIVRHNDSHAWVRAGSGVVWTIFVPKWWLKISLAAKICRTFPELSVRVPCKTSVRTA